MPDELSSPLDVPRCRRLRCKEMFYDTDTPAAPATPPDYRGSGIFWCTHTQNCLGPDGTPASDAACAPGRGCFER